MARVQCLVARANAYSATTVLPALVCAATNTDWPCSRWRTASCWKGSNSKGKRCAMWGLNLRGSAQGVVKVGPGGNGEEGGGAHVGGGRKVEQEKRCILCGLKLRGSTRLHICHTWKQHRGTEG